MNEKLEKFSEYINGKTVALIGAGVSNMGAVEDIHQNKTDGKWNNKHLPDCYEVVSLIT